MEEDSSDVDNPPDTMEGAENVVFGEYSDAVN